jgi:hypothetical protein
MLSSRVGIVVAMRQCAHSTRNPTSGAATTAPQLPHFVTIVSRFISALPIDLAVHGSVPVGAMCVSGIGGTDREG